MKPKAIFFDIDGTLVSFKTHSIPTSAKTAIRRLRDMGIKVFISTGRALCDINNLEDLVFDGFITANGAYCIDCDGKIIAQRLISRESLRKLALYLDEKPFPCGFMTNNGNFINFVDDAVSTVSKLVNLPVSPVKPVLEIIELDVFQLDAFIDNEQEAELMSILTDCSSGRWHPSFTDITAKDCNKSAGMDSFMSHYGIEKEYTMAFGDGGNDISMLQHAAIGVAMGNAGDNVKAIADYVTDTVDGDGIVKALEHFKILEAEIAPEEEENTMDAVLIECNIDDMTPERYSYVMERLFAAGADDVFLQNIIMKKTRPAVMLSVLCAPDKRVEMERLLFTETSTIGVRYQYVKKSVLDRRTVTVETQWGPVRVKEAYYKGQKLRAKPEYEDCAAIARKHNISLETVYKHLKIFD